MLLPPKWEPASVQNNKASEEQENVINGNKAKNSTMPKKAMSITLENNGDDTRSVDGSSPNASHKMRLFSKAPALLVSLTDSIKPTSHGDYMESDDPTNISNVRRSLIDQEFPNSEVSHMSTAYLKSAMSGTELNHTVSEEEEQNVHLLDEAVNLPPSEAVDDSVPSGSRGVSNAGDHIRNRFHQHRQFKKRNLDHSEFTSEEDLPYQGDSDLSLPLEILFRVALYINQAKAANKIESTLVSVTTSSIDVLVNSLTAFERIVHTPIPKAYNIHL